jgi:ELWxxDGT repeat protein
MNVDGTMYFSADDGSNGHELWKSDGTEAGTMLARDNVPGISSSYPGNLTNVNGTLFFTVRDAAHGVELWVLEGTSDSHAAGDANRDLQFDEQDIVQVLQAANYRTDAPATFEEGDWNGDGIFDQLDIVAALQTGNYLQGPYALRAIDATFATVAP